MGFGIDLDDILLRHLLGGDVLDDRDGTVQIIEVQQLIQPHPATRGDVVDDDAVTDGIDVHIVPASLSSFNISAMRIYLPFATCLK